MRYYAVTNDPNELMHFGIKGMKWGILRTPEQLGHPRHSGSRKNKPRSAAYQKASAKLSKSMHNGIEATKAKWKAYNSPKAKEARFMKKAMQQARNGTLKYGKLTDDQVRRVTERLALERNARQFGSTENPRYAKRLRMAVGEGIIRGIGQGTGAYIEERFRGRGKTTAELKADKRRLKYESRDDIQRRRALNDQRAEFYKTAIDEGDNPDYYKYGSSHARAKYLEQVKNRNKASEVKRQQKEYFDKAYYSNAGKTAGEAYARSRVNTPVTWNTSAPTQPRLTSGYSNAPRPQNSSSSSTTGNNVIPMGKGNRRRRPGRRKG